MGASGVAGAQDMPPILAPVTPAPVVSPSPSPSAEAVIPPAPVATPTAPARVAPPITPTRKAHVATVVRRAPSHHRAAWAALTKRLATARAHATTRHVALREPEPSFPPGTVVPPPSYYGPGPYQQLVYGGPPRGIYGGWGRYRGPYPYYP